VSRWIARRRTGELAYHHLLEWYDVTLICLAVLAVVPTETVDDLTNPGSDERLDGRKISDATSSILLRRH